MKAPDMDMYSTEYVEGLVKEIARLRIETDHWHKQALVNAADRDKLHALRAENAKWLEEYNGLDREAIRLRAALEEIAKQQFTDEMPAEEYLHGDYEHR